MNIRLSAEHRHPPAESNSPHPRWIFLVWGLWAVLWISTPGWIFGDGCVKTLIAGSSHGSQQVGGESISDPTVVGEHLEVTLFASRAFQGTLQLVAGDGIPVASEAVLLDPGQSVRMTLRNALVSVPDSGFQFTLQWLDGESRPMAELPVRFRLSCSVEGSCGFEAIAGLDSPDPAVDRRLATLLEEAQAGGEADLLGFVLERSPELLGEVVQWVLETSPPRDLVKSDSVDCKCSWVGSYAFSPAVIDHITQGPVWSGAPGWELVQKWKQGPRGYMAGQTIDGAINQKISADISIGMHLLCLRIRGGRPISISVSEREPIWVNLPTLEPCDVTCESHISHQATAQVCAEAKVFTGTTDGVSAVASGEIKLSNELTIDQASFANVSSQVIVNSGSSMQHKRRTKTESYGASVSARRSESAWTLTGNFFLEAARITDAVGSYGFGAVKSGYGLSVHGRSDCAPDDARIHFSDPNSEGGIVLDRWGDPP